MNYAGRRRKVVRAAEALGAGAAVITHLPDVRYLTGFTGSSGAVAIRGSRATLFTDGRYTAQAATEVSGPRIEIVQGSPAVAACGRLVAAEVTRAVFQPEHVTVTHWESLRGSLPASLRRQFLVPSPGLVSTLREVKDADELEVLSRAAAFGCKLFDDLLGWIEPGMPESEVALWLEGKARRDGAEGMSFETIVASGQRSALPHGRASSQKLPRRGFVTLDFGVVLDGYCSDMTRTVHLGKAQPAARHVYDAVLEAQQAAVQAVGPGVPAHVVDEAARSVLRQAGLDEHFTHSTGHGVGLEIHEGPRLAVKQQQVLQPGMVVTIEPGVYLPGQFGVRIEDMVCVTRDGHRVLTGSPKAYIEL